MRSLDILIVIADSDSPILIILYLRHPTRRVYLSIIVILTHTVFALCSYRARLILSLLRRLFHISDSPIRSPTLVVVLMLGLSSQALLSTLKYIWGPPKFLQLNYEVSHVVTFVQCFDYTVVVPLT